MLYVPMKNPLFMNIFYAISKEMFWNKCIQQLVVQFLKPCKAKKLYMTTGAMLVISVL
jgi:hypothetical protein